MEGYIQGEVVGLMQGYMRRMEEERKVSIWMVVRVSGGAFFRYPTQKEMDHRKI